METAVDYVDNTSLWFTTDERKWINKVMKWAEERPNEVKILENPETNDGCLVCRLPVKWFKISPPPKKKELTEEEKEALRERLRRSLQRRNDN